MNPDRPDLRVTGSVLYAADMAQFGVKLLPLQPGSLESCWTALLVAACWFVLYDLRGGL
jgi:hypothetical protein